MVAISFTMFDCNTECNIWRWEIRGPHCLAGNKLLYVRAPEVKEAIKTGIILGNHVYIFCFASLSKTEEPQGN